MFTKHPSKYEPNTRLVLKEALRTHEGTFSAGHEFTVESIDPHGRGPSLRDDEGRELLEMGMHMNKFEIAGNANPAAATLPALETLLVNGSLSVPAGDPYEDGNGYSDRLRGAAYADAATAHQLAARVKELEASNTALQGRIDEMLFQLRGRVSAHPAGSTAATEAGKCLRQAEAAAEGLKVRGPQAS